MASLTALGSTVTAAFLGSLVEAFTIVLAVGITRVWALDAGTVAESNSQFSFAPRAVCERTMSTTRTENCGGGAELGLGSTSEDGLSTAEFSIIMDRVGDTTRSSLALNLEPRF